MSNLLSTDVEYKQWLQSLSQRFRQSQIKAAVKVNQELLAFYWELGKDIPAGALDGVTRESIDSCLVKGRGEYGETLERRTVDLTI